MLWSGKLQNLHFHPPSSVPRLLGLWPPIPPARAARAPGATFSPRHIMDKINGIHGTLLLLENCFRNTLEHWNTAAAMPRMRYDYEGRCLSLSLSLSLSLFSFSSLSEKRPIRNEHILSRCLALHSTPCMPPRHCPPQNGRAWIMRDVHMSDGDVSVSLAT